MCLLPSADMKKKKHRRTPCLPWGKEKKRGEEEREPPFRHLNGTTQRDGQKEKKKRLSSTTTKELQRHFRELGGGERKKKRRERLSATGNQTSLKGPKERVASKLYEGGKPSSTPPWREEGRKREFDQGCLERESFLPGEKRRRLEKKRGGQGEKREA